MTEREFRTGVTSFYDLSEYHDYLEYYVYNFWSDDEFDNYVMDIVYNMVRDNYTRDEVYNFLHDTPTNYEFYYGDRNGRYVGLSDADFSWFMDELCDELVSRGILDEDPDEEEAYPDEAHPTTLGRTWTGRQSVHLTNDNSEVVGKELVQGLYSQEG